MWETVENQPERRECARGKTAHRTTFQEDVSVCGGLVRGKMRAGVNNLFEVSGQNGSDVYNSGLTDESR